MKIPAPLQGFLWFLVVIVFMTAMFAAAYFATTFVYQLTGITPSAPVIQLINSWGGLLLTGLTITGFTRLFRSKIVEGQNKVYGPIIEAMQRIAKGDFSVRVDNIEDRAPQERSVIGDLVNSVNQMAVELDQMETMRQEFISNVSHEIQSPLTSIRGFAQALQNSNLSVEDRQHYLTIIETESTRLSKLTDNLLKLASLEAEHVKFEPKPYRLDKQIRNLILACEPQWMSKQIDMDVSLDEVEIAADEDLLSQVWINLISNSIKFTPDKGRIKIDVHRQNNCVEFKIADTGIGVSEDHQSHIFERFYKADRSRTHSNNGGSGLGLSIAQKIVEIHKGTITVSSKLGVGTMFHVSLPKEAVGN